MNALERKVSNLISDYKNSHNGNAPKYATCSVRFNSDGDYYNNAVIAFFPYDETNPVNDDYIFFYLDKPEYIFSLLANIDFVVSDFEECADFHKEIDKYATDDESSDDWSILHRGEDFCIVDIKEVFSKMW